jgi:uncharacterized protein YdhG (YjbR/CyaY superfamily)
MKSDKVIFHSIDKYIVTFPAETQSKLQELRTVIQAAAPVAQEVIKYHMPHFMRKGNLVYFAAWKNHIGFYGTPNMPELQEELSVYEDPKSSLKFLLDKPLPAQLIRKIVKAGLAENSKKSQPEKSLKGEMK